MKPYILAESTWKTVREVNYDLAVLPWGATEAHNLHLPFGTDNIETERIAEKAAELAWNEGARPLILPCIPFGVNTGQLDIRVNINMNPSTQFAILKDIADVLNRHGIHKFLILNGHGGNDFKQLVRELGFLFPSMFICFCNWYQSVNQPEFFENDGGHADEMETSLMLHLVPELVLPLGEAGQGKAKNFRINALNERWAWAERKWSQVSTDTGVGDPSKANPEKGKLYFDAVTRKVSDLLIQLSKADTGNMYE
jgi:creatinine amidohydrolase